MEEILKAYRTLGVQPGASQKQIKKAYRDLVKRWHPDQFAKDPHHREEAEQKLRVINIAFERLQEAGSTFDLVAALRAAYAAVPRAENPTVDPARDNRGADKPDIHGTADEPKSFVPPLHAQGRQPDAQIRTPNDVLHRFRWQRMTVAVAAVAVALICILYFYGGSKPKPTGKQASAQPPHLRQNRNDLVVSHAVQPIPSPPVAPPRPKRESAGEPLEPTNLSPTAGGRSDSDEPAGVDRSEQIGVVTSQTKAANPINEVAVSDADTGPAKLEEDSIHDPLVADRELQFKMGLRFAEGDGVAQDYAEAARWYRRAAEAGHVLAQRNLGFLYASGKGVPRDFAEAERWFDKAAVEVGTTDPLTAAVLSAARSESERARRTPSDSEPRAPSISEIQFATGQRYLTGKGVARDFVEAAKWFGLAAEAGHGMAQKQLGYLYLSGKGVETNRAEAEKWLRKAAAQGVPGADFTTIILSIARERAGEPKASPPQPKDSVIDDQ